MNLRPSAETQMRGETVSSVHARADSKDSLSTYASPSGTASPAGSSSCAGRSPEVEKEKSAVIAAGSGPQEGAYLRSAPRRSMRDERPKEQQSHEIS